MLLMILRNKMIVPEITKYDDTEKPWCNPTTNCLSEAKKALSQELYMGQKFEPIYDSRSNLHE